MIISFLQYGYIIIFKLIWSRSIEHFFDLSIFIGFIHRPTDERKDK